MIPQMQRAPELATETIAQTIVQLARGASVEINVQDIPHLAASVPLLAPGKKMYVSHLPKQTWRDTIKACAAVRAAGFDPVPHIPVRLLSSANVLDQVLREFGQLAEVREVLLIAGDYPKALGPFSSVIDVLHQGVLSEQGIQRVSFAGHPEGHPKVAIAEIRIAEREKARLAAEAGLDVTLLTQFFFEHQPFVDWAEELRMHGVRARLIGGLSGPASLATLFRFAMRCGVGPSIRALGARPSSLLKLAGEHGPESVMRGLAESRRTAGPSFDGVHLFCFGGFLRTCRWLQAVADGQFEMLGSYGFQVEFESRDEGQGTRDK